MVKKSRLEKRCVKVAKRTKGIEFKLFAPDAGAVNLAGNFNDWQNNPISLRKDKKGFWRARLNLKPGRYEYKFLVDGQWQMDPLCSNRVWNSFGTENSVVMVK